MPRQLRIEYPGAIYHVMSRGDRRENIYLDDVDRQDFLKTLAEACQKTEWQVHAFCLMPNHFHLVIETPQPNLVAGNIATGTTIFGITGRCTPAPKAPEEIATVNLNSVFPPISTGVCVISSRSTTIGPYAFDVILKAKTDVSADDYLTINGVIVVPNSLYGYCGNNRIVSAAALAGTDLLSVSANTSIVISDVDTIGVGASGNGIISVMRVY